MEINTRGLFGISHFPLPVEMPKEENSVLHDTNSTPILIYPDLEKNPEKKAKFYVVPLSVKEALLSKLIDTNLKEGDIQSMGCSDDGHILGVASGK